MKKLKFCGHNSELSIRTSLELGVPYIGLIFHPHSPRYINPDDYAQLLRDLKAQYPHSRYVGVFVNEGIDKIISIVKTYSLDILQIYEAKCMSELIEYYQSTETDRPKFWFVLRVENKKQMEYQVKTHYKLISKMDLLLLDAYSPKAYGGTNTHFDWDMLVSRPLFLPPKIPLGLAGGIGLKNLTQALAVGSVSLIDICSGIEDLPGKKNIAAMKDVYKKFVTST